MTIPVPDPQPISVPDNNAPPSSSSGDLNAITEVVQTLSERLALLEKQLAKPATPKLPSNMETALKEIERAKPILEKLGKLFQAEEQDPIRALQDEIQATRESLMAQIRKAVEEERARLAGQLTVQRVVASIAPELFDHPDLLQLVKPSPNEAEVRKSVEALVDTLRKAAARFASPRTPDGGIASGTNAHAKSPMDLEALRAAYFQAILEGKTGPELDRIAEAYYQAVSPTVTL